MNATDLVRELLEVLEGHEWVYGRFGDGAECTECFASEHERSHREGCRYVAAVKAAREFLATPPVAGTPIGQLANAIQKQFPGLPVYPIDMTAQIDGPQVTLTMPDGRSVTLPASESKEFMRQTMRHYREAFNADTPGSVAKEDH